MANFEIDIGRTIDAFTDGTYKTHQALYELIDNSEAADASEIYITAEKGGNDPISRIIVSDNGVGMTPQKLIKSLKFAGDRERDITEISQYGVGMKAASFAMAREVAVITKTEDGSVCGAFLSRDRLEPSLVIHRLTARRHLVSTFTLVSQRDTMIRFLVGV